MLFYCASVKPWLIPLGSHGIPSQRNYYFSVISVPTVFISNNGHCMSNESINSLEKISHIYALTTLFILLLKNEFIYMFKNISLILKAQTLVLHFKADGNCC